MYNIAIGGISTECSSYSSLEQKKEDFNRINGKKLIQFIEFNFKQCIFTTDKQHNTSMHIYIL